MADFADLSGEPWYTQVFGYLFLILLIVITTPIVYIAAFFKRKPKEIK